MENKNSRIIIITITILLLVIVIFKTQNKHYDVKVITNDFLDSEMLAIRIKNETGEYEKTKNIPLNSYILNEEESYCGIKQDDGTYSKEEVAITYKSGKATIDKLNKYGMKCFLYFDKAPCKGVACEAILANNSVDISRMSGEFASTFEEDTSGRIFKGPSDDYGETTYFFAGANPNNWIKFANKWWRIIRINGNGSIRLIYAGSDATKEPQLTGEDTQIGTSAFNEQYDDNAYVGYMYGIPGSDNYDDTHANTNSSTIKGVLDTWYDNNIGNNEAYSGKIETKAGFCGDRSLNTTSETWWSSDTKNGYGAQATAYGPFGRLVLNGGWRGTQLPSLKCPNVANDLYTTSSASIGNKKLLKPIGLIISDEVVFAGGFGGTANSSFWLYTNQVYWTMSPYVKKLDGHTNVFRLDLKYTLNGYSVINTYGVRPVINLKADVKLTGTGTITDPYVVE